MLNRSRQAIKAAIKTNAERPEIALVKNNKMKTKDSNLAKLPFLKTCSKAKPVAKKRKGRKADDPFTDSSDHPNLIPRKDPRKERKEFEIPWNSAICKAKKTIQNRTEILNTRKWNTRFKSKSSKNIKNKNQSGGATIYNPKKCDSEASFT